MYSPTVADFMVISSTFMSLSVAAALTISDALNADLGAVQRLVGSYTRVRILYALIWISTKGNLLILTGIIILDPTSMEYPFLGGESIVFM